MLDVKAHALDPLANALELIVVAIDAAALSFDHPHRDGVTFWVEEDSLARRVRIMDVELDYETAVLTSRYQLLRLVNEDALLDEAQIEWNLLDAVEVFVKYEEVEVFGAGKV